MTQIISTQTNLDIFTTGSVSHTNSAIFRAVCFLTARTFPLYPDKNQSGTKTALSGCYWERLQYSDH